MTAILVFIELVIRGGILLAKILAVMLGVVAVVYLLQYPPAFMGVMCVVVVLLIAYSMYKSRKKKME